MKLKDWLKKIYKLLPNAKIYMFHHLEMQPVDVKSKCVLDTQKFYAFIENSSSYIKLDELINKSVYRNIGCSVLTFDDGLKDVYTIAYPFLKERNIPFSIFVLTDMIDKPGYISKDELIEMSNDELITIGLHGKTHKILTECTLAELEAEIINAKAELENIIGKVVSIFAYSHGIFTSDAIRVIKSAGFSHALSVIEHPYNIFESKKTYKVPRYNIDYTTIGKYI